MPAWIHSRAEHILAKNPSMPKGEASAIATEQSHATGHTPKGYGTAAGKREAKRTYDTPKGDEQRANPGGLRSPKMKHKTAEAAMWAGFFDELQKIALAGPGALEGAAKLVGKVHPPPLPAAARAASGAAHAAIPAAEHAAIPAATSHISGMRPAARVPTAPTPFQGAPNVAQPVPTYRGSLAGTGAPAHPGLLPGEVAPWAANPAAGPAAQRMAASNAAMQAKGHPGLAFI